MPRPINQNTQNIIELYNKGNSRLKIAKKLGVDISIINQRLRYWGIEFWDIETNNKKREKKYFDWNDYKNHIILKGLK